MPLKTQRLYFGLLLLPTTLSLACVSGTSGSPATDTDVGSETDGSGPNDETGPTNTSGSGSSTSQGTTTTSSEGSTTDSTTGDPSGDSTTADTTGDDPTGGEPVLPPVSPGCGQGVSNSWLYEHQLNWGALATAATVQVEGVAREFIVQLPPNYDPGTPYPLHIVFHAWTGNMDNAHGQRVENRWDEPVIAIAPQGQPVQGSGYGWEWWETDSIDYALVDALVEDVGQNLCVDNERIFTSGTSNGAYMAQMVACLTGYVRGVAGSAGGMPVPAQDCRAPVTAFLMHGSADTVVPISEGETARENWLDLNGCSSSSTRTADNRCDHYGDCSSGSDVYWCQHGGGHPGADPNALGLSEAMIDVFQSL